jgi:thioredoxin reductase
VSNISKHYDNKYDKELFQISCIHKDKTEIWLCDKLIIATGLSKKNIPNIIHSDIYTKHYSDYPTNYFLNKKNLEKYTNKKVLLLGHGNSSFELAQLLTPYCSNIVVLGRDTPPRPAFCSHYVGDLRSKYLGFYDTFLLKSLNAYNHNPDYTYKFKPIIIKTDLDKYHIATNETTCKTIDFDEIINCTGWLFDDSLFEESLKPVLDKNNKYPIINGLYESVNIKDLYFIGALMHSFDQKKSSGGFIHGFRYLIDNFVKINYTNFTPQLFDLDTITNQFHQRINKSSALYQMHGQLCDIFYKIDDKYIYYNEVPLSYICSNSNSKIYLPNGYIFILTLEYGTKIECDLRKIGSRTTNYGTESSSILLHPVLRIYKHDTQEFSHFDVFHPNYSNLLQVSSILEIIHFDEELLTDFSNEIKYYGRFYKTLKGYL